MCAHSICALNQPTRTSSNLLRSASRRVWMNSLDSMNRPSQPCFNRVRFDGQRSTGFAETLLSRRKIGPIRKLLKPLDPTLSTALPEQCAPAPAFDSPDERIIPIAVGGSGNAEETGTTSQLRLLRLGCSLNRIRYRVYLFRFSVVALALFTSRSKSAHPNGNLTK
jgi:hypothetical protein